MNIWLLLGCVALYVVLVAVVSWWLIPAKEQKPTKQCRCGHGDNWHSLGTGMCLFAAHDHANSHFCPCPQFQEAQSQ